MSLLNTLDVAPTGVWNFSGGAATNKYWSVEAGITAATSPAQGRGPLTKHINQVSVSGTSGDCVTLPVASIGAFCMVINDAAVNTVKIYTAAGDFFNVDASGVYIVQSAGTARLCYCYAANHWFTTNILRSTGI